MSERVALLFDDESMLVLPEKTRIEDAIREAKEHDEGEIERKTRVVMVEIIIKEERISR